MGQYFFGISKEEKENILNQHRTIYDGYVTMYGQNNQQPLYTQDFANDKDGITVSNKGDVKAYTNMNINESHSGLDMIGDGEDDLINGTVDIDDETRWEPEDIEYISLGLEDECEDCGEMMEGFDDEEYFEECPSCGGEGCDSCDYNGEIPLQDHGNYVYDEMEEGFDDPYIQYARKNKDFSHKEFKPVPKGINIDMRNVRDDSVTPGKYLSNKLDDFMNLLNPDLDDDFDPLSETDFSNDVDEDILPEFTEKLNESLDMFRRFRKYN